MRKLVYLSILVLSACGENGGGFRGTSEPLQHVPEISSFSLSPDTAKYMDGEGTVVVIAEISFRDSGLDIQTFWVRMPDGASIEFSESFATETGTFTEDLAFPTNQIGTSNVEIWLVDDAGDSSVHHTAEFDVVGNSDSAAIDIVLSDVALDQIFQSSLESYTATVSLFDSTTKVTVSPSDDYATIAVNGATVGPGVASDKIDLDEGVNTITVVVTATDRVTSTTYTFDVTRLTVESLAQRAYIKASNTEANDQFGASVALDGDTLAVGAPLEDSNAIGIGGDQGDNSAPDSGAVYVFIRDASGVWSQQAYIKASSTDANDKFGASVALDGDTLAVGAPLEDSSATGIGGIQGDYSAPDSGAVYVYTGDASGVWSQQAYIKASNTEANDQFGASAALDGDTLAVGAPLEDSSATGIGGIQGDNSAPDSGAVYVYSRNASGVWSQQAYIKASNTDKSDVFGESVALDGDTLAVGAPGYAPVARTLGTEAKYWGAAYVFTRYATGMWSEQAFIGSCYCTYFDSYDQFGAAVALNGDTLAVGALEEESGATGIDGDQGDNSVLRAGAGYIFAGDASGAWGDGAWDPQVYIKASNTGEADYFGVSVTLDGDTLAVGASGEDSSATGINGDQSDNSTARAGAVYVFE